LPVQRTVPAPSLDAAIADLRRFNRLYTRRIGVLSEGHLNSPFSLAEVRVLYELARGARFATELHRTLGLDRGYLSRILRRLQAQRLLSRMRSAADARQATLRLTPSGRRVFSRLDGRANAAMRALLETMPPSSRRQLRDALRVAERALENRRLPDPVVLRAPRPGDYGWIVHRHGALYASEYGWDERFEALVAGIVARFIARFRPDRERCWVAERGGEIVGSVFLVEESRTIAKLRLLYVEPAARGEGVGTRLVNECLSFAQAAGYRRVRLWTNSVLHAARRIYESAGFRLVAEAPHSDFGVPLVGQVWEISLSALPGGSAGPRQTQPRATLPQAGRGRAGHGRRTRPSTPA
jgi:DNA-binding MarR family transcriptional regulator/N-acetylglutamate synthase-like GNAT family acetyltransferase